MPFDRVQENTSVDGREKNENVDFKKILQQKLAIVNSYTLIGILYCIFSSILFFSAAGNYFLGWIFLLALLSAVSNYLILTRKNNSLKII